MTRMHVSLTVSDLPRSVAFYRELFATEPEHVRPDHAKFAPEEPAVNFTLNPGRRPDGRQALSHLGIEVRTADELARALHRLRAAGLPVWEERAVDCCYALQDKFWIRDPDGNEWEFFLVHASTLPSADAGRSEPCATNACCERGA